MTKAKKGNAIPRTITLALLLAVALTATACPGGGNKRPGLTAQQIQAAQADPDWPADGSLTAWSIHEDIPVRDPLDPANPFRDDYTEYELWCYRNIINQDDIQERFFDFDEETGTNPLPDGQVYIRGTVTQDGWMNPIRKMLADDWKEHLGYTSPFPKVYPGYMSCLGQMDREQMEGLQALHGLAAAPYLPPIPEWVLDHPCYSMQFTVDGMVLLQGEVETEAETPLHPVYSTGMNWFISENDYLPYTLYDSDGNLIGRTGPKKEWWTILLDDVEELTGYPPEEVEGSEYWGTVSFYLLDEDGEADIDQKIGSFDLTGSPRENNRDSLRDYDPRCDLTIFGPGVRAAYEEQQRCEPILPCGWDIGTGDLADLDPTQPIACGDAIGGGGILFGLPLRLIQIRPLDAPGNPYAGMYSQWDRLAWTCLESRWQKEGADQTLALAQLELDFTGADGWEGIDEIIEAETRSSGYRSPHKIAEAEGWIRNGINWDTFDIHVNDDGYVVPALLQFQKERCPVGPDNPAVELLGEKTYMGFRTETVGVISEELEQQRRAAELATIARYLPPIHYDLVVKPPRRVMFMPDGEFVTDGPLGGLHDLTHSDTDYHRYSAEAVHRGQISWMDGEWYELFFPEVVQITEKLGGAENIDHYESDGVINFYVRDDAADGDYGSMPHYTYQGEYTEHWISEERTFCFEWFTAEEIPVMYEAQQAD